MKMESCTVQQTPSNRHDAPNVVRYGRSMTAMPSTTTTIELIPDLDQGGFTARVPDIPAYGEGATEDEAIADLKEALRAYIDVFGVQEAVSRVSMQLSVRQVTWNLNSLVRG